jgi:hypothetical protein
MVIADVVTGAMTFLSDLPKAVREWRTLRRQRQQKQILRQGLESGQYQWRKLSTLAGLIGEDEAETKRLLIDLGARGSATNEGEVWGLRSRVGDG